jgi:hypothetical protein
MLPSHTPRHNVTSRYMSQGNEYEVRDYGSDAGPNVNTYFYRYGFYNFSARVQALKQASQFKIEIAMEQHTKHPRTVQLVSLQLIHILRKGCPAQCAWQAG